MNKDTIIKNLVEENERLQAELQQWKKKYYIIDPGIRNTFLTMNEMSIGSNWETICVMERLKFHTNQWREPKLFYWRNNDNAEVDIIDMTPGFEKALEVAKEQNKIVFVDFWASWCGPCRSMDAEVLSDPELAKFFNENFINYKIDADSEEAIIPKINYDVRSLPTYVWVNGNGEMIHIYKGTTTISNFIAQAKMAISKK